MAVWQFNFALIPRAGIVRVHGCLVDSLDEYRGSFAPEVRDFPNYWVGTERSAECGAIAEILPPMESWSADARMFGTEDGDRIQVWPDDISCDVDVRNFRGDYLEKLLRFAATNDLVVVLKDGGEVLEPDIGLMIERIRSSRAFAFCDDPVGYLKGLATQ